MPTPNLVFLNTTFPPVTLFSSISLSLFLFFDFIINSLIYQLTPLHLSLPTFTLPAQTPFCSPSRPPPLTTVQSARCGANSSPPSLSRRTKMVGKVHHGGRRCCRAVCKAALQRRRRQAGSHCSMQLSQHEPGCHAAATRQLPHLHLPACAAVPEWRRRRRRSPRAGRAAIATADVRQPAARPGA